jgi:ribonuclease VapC
LASPSVLDASAVLAVLFSEPGGEQVVPMLQGALLSSVNLAEIHTILLIRGVGANFAWQRVLDLGCDVSPFDEQQARTVGELIAQTRPYGLSLGDRACLALAIERKATVYTTDAAWKKLGLALRVEVIG